MRRFFNGAKVAGVACFLSGIVASMPGTPCQADGYVETFTNDPVAGGRFLLHDGEGTAWRFVHQMATQSLRAHYDTGLPTARLIYPLGRTLTQTDAFTCRATFTIRHEGFYADDGHIAQIAFGLMNMQTTGIDRVYGFYGGAYDLVSFDYYPNVSDAFGGPSLGPTIISGDSGVGFFGSINFSFGQETTLDGPDSDCNLSPGDDFIMSEAGGDDRMLTAELKYAPDTQSIALRVFENGEALDINNIGENCQPGGRDVDTTTIVTLLTGAGFSVDALGILLWRDYSSTTSSVIADVDYHRLEVWWPSFGDFDGDGDVDHDDDALFNQCASGPGVPYAAGCELRDGDGDGDVDQSDFGKFQTMFTGPG